MKTTMTSKERIRATIRHEETDHLPLVFDGIGHGWANFIHKQYPDTFKRNLFYLEQGIDTGIRLSGWLYSKKTFTTRDWEEYSEEDQCTIYGREYITPKGNLQQIIRVSEDYPTKHVHALMSDFHMPPTRSKRYLVEKEEDLDKLEYILTFPDKDELEDFYAKAKESKKFCEKHGITLSYYHSGIGDPLMWMSGAVNVIMAGMDNPDFLERYVDIVGKWSMKHLQMAIDAGCDHIIRRGWYESTDFWSPDLYRKFLMKPMMEHVKVCREAGLTIEYIMNSGSMPLLETIKEMKPDILSSIDPTNVDLVKMKQVLGKDLTLCGGVNNFLVLERGTEEEVEKAVRRAVEILSPGGGYILGSSDAIGFEYCDEQTEKNFRKMISVWKEMQA